MNFVNNQEIANKLWKEAGVLRKGGVTSQDYLTELTFLLFLFLIDLIYQNKLRLLDS